MTRIREARRLTSSTLTSKPVDVDVVCSAISQAHLWRLKRMHACRCPWEDVSTQIHPDRGRSILHGQSPHDLDPSRRGCCWCRLFKCLHKSGLEPGRVQDWLRGSPGSCPVQRQHTGSGTLIVGRSDLSTRGWCNHEATPCGTSNGNTGK